jgi:hypothetical protein
MILIIPARDFEEGLNTLRKILNRLRQHGLTLKLSKCSFFQTRVEYLGREIFKNGVRPGLRKIEVVRNMPEPGNVKQLRQFLGLAGHFRRFINRKRTVARNQ